MTLAAESPTRIASMPAASRMRAVVKSYAVSMDIFSPRRFMAMSVCTVIFFFAGVCTDIMIYYLSINSI